MEQLSKIVHAEMASMASVEECLLKAIGLTCADDGSDVTDRSVLVDIPEIDSMEKTKQNLDMYIQENDRKLQGLQDVIYPIVGYLSRAIFIFKSTQGACTQVMQEISSISFELMYDHKAWSL